MKKTLLNTSLGLALCSSLFAGPIDDIAKKHATAKALEIESYLQANPKSDEKDKAVNYLLEAYALTENTTRSIALLQERFDTLGSGADVDPQKLYMTTQSLFALKLAADDKTGAKKLIADAKKKSEGNDMANRLDSAFSQLEGKLKMPSKGDTMEVKFTSLQGKEVDLAAMKGKVVLIDFWATWCGPCIAELPHVLKTYEKYHAKGFEVIGISLDKESAKEKLEAFIKDKNMPWPQYFDGKGWKSDLVTKYGISGIPATFLIGPDGTVVATDLRGDSLEKAVSKHLAK